jgi:hypothetical protein
MFTSFSAEYRLVIIWLIALAGVGLAQPGVKELPIVAKPRERSSAERVVVVTKPVQPSKGVLAVVLSRYINAQVVVKDSSGRVLEKKDAGEQGQAEFQLQRGRIYQVEASHPGYLSVSSKTRPLGATSIVRLDLVPQSASLKIRNLPEGAQILIDDQPRATADKTGAITISDLAPGEHSLTIRHPEYNDYTDRLPKVAAGDEVNYGRIPLTRVAKLTIQGPPGATILIDGAVQGKINPEGAVRIDYELDQASERVISVELLGYQPWSKRELLSPGPRTITIKLDPIVTSAGVSDFFDNLSLWNAPPSWKIVSDARNRKLEVKGEQLGLLNDKVYRDFDANFLLWLGDGKGATWAIRVSKDGRSYYLFHLAGPKSTTHTPKRFYTYLVKDGADPIEVSTPIPVLLDLDKPGPFTVTISARGYTITQSITDRDAEESDLGVWTDTTVTKERFLYGSFGFRTLSGEVFQVDDLNLEPLNPEPAKRQ